MPQTRAKGKKILLALFWLLSLSALCVSLSPVTAATGSGVAWTRTLQGSGAWFLAAVALGIGHVYLGGLSRALRQTRLWMLAIFLAAVATLGESFAQTGTATLVLTGGWPALLYFAGRIPAFYLGMALLSVALARREPENAPESRLCANGAPYAAQGESAAAAGRRRTLPLFEAQREKGNEPQAQPMPVPADYRRHVTATARVKTGFPLASYAGSSARGSQRAGWPTWAFALLLLACWLPWLYFVWPGTVSNDSIAQLAQVFGRKALSNGNPIFQTGLAGLFVWIGKGWFGSADAAVALYIGVQSLLMAWLLGYTLRRMAESRAPGWLVWLAAAFYAFCPVFPVFAFCVGKDTNFAMATLWFSMMAWRVVQSKWPPFRTVAGLCLSAALCALLRNAGAAMAGFTLLILLIWTFTRGTRQWRAPLMALATLGAVMALVYLVAIPQLGAQPTPETENESVRLQQVARAVASETLTDEERAAIDAVMPVDQIQAAYNGELSDPVKALWRDTVTEDQRRAFFTVWLKLGLKHPATYLSATFHNSYGYLLPGYVSTIKPTFLMGMEGRTTLIDGAFDFTVNPRAETLKTALQSLFAVAPFRLMVAPGGYGWLILYALAALMACRLRANAICLLPALLTLIGCLGSAVNGYFRYAMPLYFAAPAMLALVSQALAAGPRVRADQPL